MKEQIRNYIHTHKSETIAFASYLVQQSSVRGNEGETQAIVVEKCRQLGLEIDLWELDDMSDLKDNPNFHCDRKSFRGAPNLVAVLKGSGEGKSIILNGHIDVVPEGNRKDWTDDPFSGIVKDGKMYGRGTTDMKGGNVSLLMALEALVKNNVKLKGDVIFQSVIEEESGGAGTLAAVLRGYQADGAIIPEPTDLKFFPYQQGSLWFRLTIKGKSAHGGTRYEGTSSLDLAFDVIENIKQLEKERNELLQEEPLYASIPIPIPINIGVCHSGNWPSSVPDVTILEGRYGVSPHETMENAMSMMEQKIKQLNDAHEWFKEKPVELDWFGARWLPNKLELNHPLLQSLTENYIMVENKLPKIEAAPWGTDGGILSSLAQTPTIVFGPGTTKKAHDSNEYIEIEKMVKAAEIIAFTIIDWCEIEESHSQ